jgi:hypothetical protein
VASASIRQHVAKASVLLLAEAGLRALRERRMRVNKADFTAAKEQVLYRKNENTVSCHLDRLSRLLNGLALFSARRIVSVGSLVCINSEYTKTSGGCSCGHAISHYVSNFMPRELRDHSAAFCPHPVPLTSQASSSGIHDKVTRSRAVLHS